MGSGSKQELSPAWLFVVIREGHQYTCSSRLPGHRVLTTCRCTWLPRGAKEVGSRQPQTTSPQSSDVGGQRSSVQEEVVVPATALPRRLQAQVLVIETE
ncbi:hypothetical protein SFRURICE_020495 [Spodoptera frugiperda]|nr:hypothetical protein SFRURICE_020495 [Spodoptera frugiperda]